MKSLPLSAPGNGARVDAVIHANEQVLHQLDAGRRCQQVDRTPLLQRHRHRQGDKPVRGGLLVSQ